MIVGTLIINHILNPMALHNNSIVAHPNNNQTGQYQTILHNKKEQLLIPGLNNIQIRDLLAYLKVS